MSGVKDPCHDSKLTTGHSAVFVLHICGWLSIVLLRLPQRYLSCLDHAAQASRQHTLNPAVHAQGW